MRKYTVKRRKSNKSKKRYTLKGGINEMTRCSRFCKNDYMPNIAKVVKKYTGSVNIDFAHKPKYKHMVCKMIYCNKGCPNKNARTGFYKDIKNDFNIKYTDAEIKKMKDKGALTGCVRDELYMNNFI